MAQIADWEKEREREKKNISLIQRKHFGLQKSNNSDLFHITPPQIQIARF